MNNKLTMKSMLGFLQGNTAILAVLAMMALGTVTYGSTFLNYGKNIYNVIRMASLIGIMGIGVNLCFFIGGRDLSVGAVAALTSVVTAYLSNYNVIFGIIGGLGVGLVFGFINGYVISRFKVQPFIATLGTQLAARGFALLINNEYSIPLLEGTEFIKKIGNESILNGLVSIPTAVFIILIALFSFILKYTHFGRSIYAVGGNEEAAEMMCVRVKAIKLAVFTISGLLAAISGIILTGRLNAGQPTACEGWEMTIMAAVVIGGTSVRGGSGKIWGIFFGVVFVQFISNLINLNGRISAYWQDILTGIILLLALFTQAYQTWRKEKVAERREFEKQLANS